MMYIELDKTLRYIVNSFRDTCIFDIIEYHKQNMPTAAKCALRDKLKCSKALREGIIEDWFLDLILNCEIAYVSHHNTPAFSNKHLIRILKLLKHHRYCEAECLFERYMHG